MFHLHLILKWKQNLGIEVQYFFSLWLGKETRKACKMLLWLFSSKLMSLTWFLFSSTSWISIHWLVTEFMLCAILECKHPLIFTWRGIFILVQLNNCWKPFRIITHFTRMAYYFCFRIQKKKIGRQLMKLSELNWRHLKAPVCALRLN